MHAANPCQGCRACPEEGASVEKLESLYYGVHEEEDGHLCPADGRVPPQRCECECDTDEHGDTAKDDVGDVAQGARCAACSFHSPYVASRVDAHAVLREHRIEFGTWLREAQYITRWCCDPSRVDEHLPEEQVASGDSLIRSAFCRVRTDQ